MQSTATPASLQTVTDAGAIIFGPTSGQHLLGRAEKRAATLTAETGTRHTVGVDWVNGLQMFVLVPHTEPGPEARQL